MKLRRTAYACLLLLVLFVSSTLIANLILSGTTQTRLKTETGLAGEVSQSLITSSSGASLPKLGKDFDINSTQYFDNKQWAVVVATILSINESAALVLERVGGNYQVVLGPGTEFSSQDIQAMPNDLQAYLINQGLVDNAI